MLVNKCYVSAKYLNHYNGFIHIAIRHSQYLIYIGYLAKQTIILAKLAKTPYFSAICEIYYASNGNYPDMSGLPSEIISILDTTPNAIWLQALKINPATTKLTGNGYFALQDKDAIMYGRLKENCCLAITHTTIRSNMEKPRIIPPELRKFFPNH